MPMSNLFHEEFFPTIQSKPPPVQLEADSSCPITCCLGGKTNPHLSSFGYFFQHCSGKGINEITDPYQRDIFARDRASDNIAEPKDVRGTGCVFSSNIVFKKQFKKV